MSRWWLRLALCSYSPEDNLHTSLNYINLLSDFAIHRTLLGHTRLVLSPHFIEDSYVVFICSDTFLEQSLVFLVKSILDVCRDKVDYRGESGFGLRGVGCAVNCEAPGWIC